MSLGNHKLKQQGETATHLLEWPRSKTLVTPNPDGDTEQQELLVAFIAGDKVNW